MIITQIVKIRLKQEFETGLSDNTVEWARDWPNKFACINNYQACISEDTETCIKMCREEFINMFPSWVLNSYGVEHTYFEFQVNRQVVKNKFWMNPDIIDCHWYSIEGE